MGSSPSGDEYFFAAAIPSPHCEGFRLGTVRSLIIENEPAAVLNFFSGVSVAAAASILRYLMIFSVLNSAPSRHSRLRAVAASLAASRHRSVGWCPRAPGRCTDTCLNPSILPMVMTDWLRSFLLAIDATVPADSSGHALRSGERCQCALSTSRQQLRGVAAGGGAVSQPRALIPATAAVRPAGHHPQRIQKGCAGPPSSPSQRPSNSAEILHGTPVRVRRL